MILRREPSPPNALDVLTFLLLLLNLTVLSYAVFAPLPFSIDTITDLQSTVVTLETEVNNLKIKGEDKTNTKH